jgi:hypothetical protein
MTNNCCAQCGKDEGGDVSLKTCTSCKAVKYCDAACQRNHWPKHKKSCKQRAAELRDEALFKDPPPKEDCPICFIPMPLRLFSCATLPGATRLSIPIHDFAIAHEMLKDEDMELYYPCCGKEICKGCVHSFSKTDNDDKCPYCNSDRVDKTDEEDVEEAIKRVEANDPVAMCIMANFYRFGEGGLQQDEERAMELFTRAADLGYYKARLNIGNFYYRGGDMKKAKFHFEAAAMAGHEVARFGRLLHQLENTMLCMN